VKPANQRFPDLVYNEYACMKIAKSLGIVTPNVRLAPTTTQSFYIIDRYDRIFHNNEIQRLHQEDFCQAIGIQNQNKYESDGGPTFKQCVDLLRKATSVPAIEVNRFVSLFLFNIIIGNKDAHGKNYSILHKNYKQELAPAYDILSTSYYPELSVKMSMSINGKFELDEVVEEDLFRMSESANISGTMVLKEYQRIKNNLLPIAEKALSENLFPDHCRNAFYDHLKKLHSQLMF
jgi:serine/threonine-protein kinase HipA